MYIVTDRQSVLACPLGNSGASAPFFLGGGAALPLFWGRETALLPFVWGGTPPRFFRERALALSPRSTFKPLGGVEVERFFRRGAPLPIFQALRCCGGAALLQRKEWRAAKARISLVVRRRCCPSSALELEQRRAANACEAGPRRLATSPHLDGGPP